jgi:hypothetical protein
VALPLFDHHRGAGDAAATVTSVIDTSHAPVRARVLCCRWIVPVPSIVAAHDAETACLNTGGLGA